MNCLRIPAAHIPGPDDPAIIRSMAPAEFLSLALPMDHDDGDSFDAGQVVYWDDWPFLMVDPVTGQIHGHEGRHRVAAAARSGVAAVDVILFLTPDPAGMTVADAMAWQWDGRLPERLIPETACAWRAYLGGTR